MDNPFHQNTPERDISYISRSGEIKQLFILTQIPRSRDLKPPIRLKILRSPQFSSSPYR